MIGTTSSSWGSFFRRDYTSPAGVDGRPAPSEPPSTTTPSQNDAPREEDADDVDDAAPDPSPSSAVTAGDSSSGRSPTAVTPEPPSAGASSADTEITAAFPASSGSTTPTYTSQASDSRLHSITERKLEKAVLGRAVGLRQLVLLSNTFASRSRNPTPPPEPAPLLGPEPHFQGGLQYQYGRWPHGMLDVEDEMERKRREEDWLDSMLDEMLTDEEEDVGDADDDDEERSRDSADQPSTHRHRDLLREPYVHLSIKDPSSVHQLSVSTLHEWSNQLERLQHQSSSQPEPTERSVATSEMPQSVLLNEYVDAAAVPLPLSSQHSPTYSRASRRSSDDDTVRPSDSDSEDGDLDPAFLQEVNHTAQYGTASLRTEPIQINTGPYSLANLSTPELAYSVNSFFSNVSSSPSSSLHIGTPESYSPASFLEADEGRGAHMSVNSGLPQSQTYERRHDALRHLRREQETDLDQDEEAIILPMEGLDFEEDTSKAYQSKGRQQEGPAQHGDPFLLGSSSGSLSSSLSSSLELVRYQPSIQSVELGEPFRISRSGILSPPASTSSNSPSSTLPGLPPPTLSSFLGRSTPYEQRSPVLKSHLTLGTGGGQREAKVTNGPQASHGVSDRIQLPIFVPYEIVKSLYDRVDFGVPPNSPALPSSITSPPELEQAVSLPGLLFTTWPEYQQPSASLARPTSPPSPRSDAFSNSPKSCPTSPRSQGRLLKTTESDVQHDSSGSLLFSSLGRFSSALPPGGRHESDALARVTRSSPSFGRGIVDEWERRGFLISSGKEDRAPSRSGRNDSRSPSRLRMPLHAEELGGDFEFGSL